MGFLKDIFSSVFSTEESSITKDSSSSYHGGMNIDGTPMIDEFIDINGDAYGCPSSIHEDLFSSDISEDIDDISFNMLDDDSW